MEREEEIVYRVARETAEHFVTHEGAFHLGFLPTEQSHPATSDFSRKAVTHVEQAIDQVFSVDQELASVARRIVLSTEFNTLVTALSSAARTARDASRRSRVCFSGCGSTGRLAIMLEAMWRSFFEGNDTVANLAHSVMTGGDRALIKAVENFEDYEAFGARQIEDLGLGSDDIVVAISEGGETSSVIGTAREALRRGCTVFFLYNNPTSLLRGHIARSRQLLEDPRVTCIDLFSGPMALSGSTRMQATTLEMLVVGIAMEEAIARPESEPHQTGNEPAITPLPVAYRRLSRVDAYVTLLQSLRRPENRATVGALATREAELYRNAGRVTYFADDYLLDIFSDTTERSPTFMIPPFRSAGDTASPVSWAFAKNPRRTTENAWMHMLRRKPRGIEWTAADYRKMGANEGLIDCPPTLNVSEIHSYTIGREDDESRRQCDESLALWVDVDGSLGRHPKGEWQGSPYTHDELLVVTSTRGTRGEQDEHPRNGWPAFDTVYPISLEIEPSPIKLFHHLALKLIFNTFSTTSMAIAGRVVGNWMVQVDPTNKKLIDRGTRLVSELAGMSYERACFELHVSIERRKKQLSSGVANSESPVVTTLRRLGVSLGSAHDA